jgi:hypothetical protein
MMGWDGCWTVVGTQQLLGTGSIGASPKVSDLCVYLRLALSRCERIACLCSVVSGFICLIYCDTFGRSELSLYTKLLYTNKCCDQYGHMVSNYGDVRKKAIST